MEDVEETVVDEEIQEEEDKQRVVIQDRRFIPRAKSTGYRGRGRGGRGNRGRGRGSFRGKGRGRGLVNHTVRHQKEDDHLVSQVE